MHVPCAVCGKPVKSYPCRKKTRYCSQECESAGRRSRTKYEDRTCPQCGKDFKAPACQTKHGYYKFCSNKCRLAYHRGKNATTYKGGWIRPDGYRQIQFEGRPKLEHDVVWYTATGKWPTRQEHIHHKDGNKLNNDIANLVLLPANEHFLQHPISEIGIQKNREFHQSFCKTRQRDNKGQFICKSPM